MPTLHSFKPFANAQSRILILGTMPGPEALRRREYYGYPGNHFWPIMTGLFGAPELRTYAEKKELLRTHHIALWDVIQTCTRQGASDAAIRDIVPNPIPEFVSKHRLNAIFFNGSLAENLYRRYFGGVIHLPLRRLPSTSPAYAALSLGKKRDAWRGILPYLENRNPWC